MTKVITKIGKSQGLLFDDGFMDRARLSVGDHVNVTIQEGGAIVLTPVREITTARAGASARRLIKKNSALFKRLS